jgi:PKD repeat protein
VVNGKTYMKIGWNDYDGGLGYGWYSDPNANWMAQYLDSGPNELQRSIIYSDWGRPATFEFDMPNGQYNVTVSVGWQGGTYSHHKIDIEGTGFVNDEATTPSNSYLVRTKPVTISDNKLTMAMGIFDEYTMLNYLEVEAAGPTANFTADPTAGAAPLTVYFRDTSTNGPSGWEWDFDDDGSVDSTEQHPTHTYNQAGVYSVRLRVSNTGGSDELRKEDLITARLPAVTDLGVSQAVTGSGLLTATLRWTPVTPAVTTTLRYSLAVIDEVNWAAANLIIDTLPGSASSYTAVLPYSGQTIYFALKSQNAAGAWLGLSNLAFWPRFDLYLPLALRQGS